MKKNIFILPLLLLISLGSIAQADASKKESELTWYTDILKANEISISSNKPIFAFFTGSDWCGWCKKLQRDVFAKPEFIQWAKKNVVLLELDFPRNKQLSPELTQQNAGLQQAFQIQGYPTIWIFFLSKDEKTMKFNISPLGSLGYPPGAEPGKEEVKFLKDANAILEKKNVK
jgi:thioredoxin-related protein